MIFSLIGTRYLIELIGINNYAAHAVIMSLCAWIVILNFGIPSTIQNIIAKRRELGLDCIRLNKTAFRLIITIYIILIPILLIGAILIKNIIFESNVYLSNYVIFIYLIGFLTSGFILFFTQTLYAIHKPIWPNILSGILSAITLLGVIILRAFDEKSLTLIALIYSFPQLLIFAILISNYEWKNWDRYDTTSLHEIVNKAKGFLLFSILGTATLSVDYIILSRIVMPVEISIYNIVQKVFMIILIAYGIILTSSWTTISELMHSCRFREVILLIYKLLRLGCILIFSIGVFFVYFTEEIIFFLSNGKITYEEKFLSSLFLLYISIRIFTDTYATVLLSNDNTNMVNLTIPIQCCLGIFLQYQLSKLYGVEGILIGLIFSFILTATWVLPFKFYKLVKIRNKEINKFN